MAGLLSLKKGLVTVSVLLALHGLIKRKMIVNNSFYDLISDTTKKKKTEEGYIFPIVERPHSPGRRSQSLEVQSAHMQPGEDIRAKFVANGQEHVFRFFHLLSKEEQVRIFWVKICP